MMISIFTIILLLINTVTTTEIHHHHHHHHQRNALGVIILDYHSHREPKGILFVITICVGSLERAV